MFDESSQAKLFMKLNLKLHWKKFTETFFIIIKPGYLKEYFAVNGTAY